MADAIIDSRVSTPPGQGLIALTHVVYALHTLSVLTGPAIILTAFLFGWPSIIGVIINLVKRDEVRGTYLESHFSWQIRTFFYALLWIVVLILLVFTFVGILVAVPLAIVLGIWVLYRIIRGWLALAQGKAVEVTKYP